MQLRSHIWALWRGWQLQQHEMVLLSAASLLGSLTVTRRAGCCYRSEEADVGL